MGLGVCKQFMQILTPSFVIFEHYQLLLACKLESKTSTSLYKKILNCIPGI